MKKCQDGLSHKQRRMRRLYWAQSGRCYLCGEIMIAPSVARYHQNDPRNASIDHVHPRSRCRKGKNHRGNLLLAHRSCNEKKCSQLPTEKQIKLAKLVYDFSILAVKKGLIDLTSTDVEII